MPRLPRFAWALWIVVGLGLEAWALVSRAPGDTLTETLVATAPAWLVFGFLAWATKHFQDRY